MGSYFKVNINGIRFKTLDVVLVTPATNVISSSGFNIINYKISIYLRGCPKCIEVVGEDKEALELAISNIFSIPAMPFSLDGLNASIIDIDLPLLPQ